MELFLQADNSSPQKPPSLVEGSIKATGEQRDSEYRRKYGSEGLSSQIPVHSVLGGGEGGGQESVFLISP